MSAAPSVGQGGAQPVVRSVPEAAQGLRGEERVKDLRQRAREAAVSSAFLAQLPSPGFFQDQEGRPLPLNGVYWSVSHKRGLVAGVAAAEPVGIDVEALIGRKDFPDNMLSVAEERILQKTSNVHPGYRAWVAKEAVLKARGVGLFELPHIRVIFATENRAEVEHRGTRMNVGFSYPLEHVAAVTLGEGEPHWHGVAG